MRTGCFAPWQYSLRPQQPTRSEWFSRSWCVFPDAQRYDDRKVVGCSNARHNAAHDVEAVAENIIDSLIRSGSRVGGHRCESRFCTQIRKRCAHNCDGSLARMCIEIACHQYPPAAAPHIDRVMQHIVCLHHARVTTRSGKVSREVHAVEIDGVAKLDLAMHITVPETTGLRIEHHCVGICQRQS